jgi:teichuronic acid biosynthesis glycosyltransferase TuaC
MISVLTISTLYPNPVQPAHGAFVETRLRYLRASGLIAAEVIAPVPWLPPIVSYPAAGQLKSVPYMRQEGDLRIHHPRYLVIPKVGMNLAPFTLYLCLKRALSKLLAQGRRFDIIDAHYFYPDGVAAVRLAQEFGIPVCVTARGTDLNLIPEFKLPRRMIVNAAMQADGIVTVCQALKDRLIELAPKTQDVRVLRLG